MWQCSANKHFFSVRHMLSRKNSMKVRLYFRRALWQIMIQKKSSSLYRWTALPFIFGLKGALLHQISVLVTIIQHTKRNKGGAWPSWTSERLSPCATLFCSLWIFTKRWSSRKLRTVQTSPCNFSTTSYKNQSNVRNSKYVLLINS